MVALDLWPRPYRLRSFAGRVMRLSDDVRKCVVFIGFSDGKGGFEAAGTGFLILYKENIYLVTNQHIAAGLNDSPFAVRINKIDDGSDNFLIDPLTNGVMWYSGQSLDVDLAVIPFNYDLWKAGLDVKVFPSDLFAVNARIEEEQIGVGDLCYTVGLFRLMAGKTRNVPVVHSGNIALMPGQEKVPVQEWMQRSPTVTTRYVEGYLIEATNLKGLSGSPVFVRPTLDWADIPLSDGRSMSARLPRTDIFLLGIWQGSWDARPDDVMGVEHGIGVRVPVGIGVVVPVSNLIDLLETEELQMQRDTLRITRERETLASPDTGHLHTE